MWLEITWFLSFLTIFNDFVVICSKNEYLCKKQPFLYNYSFLAQKLYVLVNINTKRRCRLSRANTFMIKYKCII